MVIHLREREREREREKERYYMAEIYRVVAYNPQESNKINCHMAERNRERDERPEKVLYYRFLSFYKIYIYKIQ